jgi:hypothetical protein
MIIKFYCNYCRFGTGLIADMKRHIKMKKHIKLSDGHDDIDDYKTTMYKCDSCKNIYKNKSSLVTHTKTHTISEQKYVDQNPQCQMSIYQMCYVLHLICVKIRNNQMLH